MHQTLRTFALLALAVPVVAQVDPNRSSISVSPGSTFLNGIVKISVVPRDANGRRLGPGQTVEVSSTLGVFSGGTVDQGNGLYYRVMAGNAVGTASITAKVNGTALTRSASLKVLDPSNLGNIIGIDYSGNVKPFSSIQAAVDFGRYHCYTTRRAMRRIFVAPGRYNEVVRVAYRYAPLSIEGLSMRGPVFLKGLRVYRSARLSLRYLVVEGIGARMCRSYVNMEFSSVIGAEGPNGEKLSGLVTRSSAVYAGNCFFWKNTNNGVSVGAASRVSLFQCVVEESGRNGVWLSSYAMARIRECLLTESGAYGIVRNRSRYNWSPRYVTLIQNQFSLNNGTVEAGKSTVDIGNYDLIIDSTDQQTF